MAIRVMVGDDPEHVREMLATMLELDGFDVVAKLDGGQAAIDTVAASAPNVIVMDYKMPQRDGNTATKDIRTIVPDVPVILYTASLDDDLEARPRDAGGALCLGKV